MLIQTINAHSSSINSIKFSNKGNLFTTCSNDSIVKVWHFNSNRLIDEIKLIQFLRSQYLIRNMWSSHFY